MSSAFDSFPDFPEQVDFSSASETPTTAPATPLSASKEEPPVEEEQNDEEEDALFSIGPVPDHLVAQYFERRAIKIERETRQRNEGEEKRESELYIAKLEAQATEARSRSSGTSWPALPSDVLSLFQDEHGFSDGESNIQLLEAEQTESTSLLTGEVDEEVRREYQLLSIAARQDHDSSSSDSDFDGEFESYGFAEVSASSFASSSSTSAFAASSAHVDDSSSEDVSASYEPLNENENDLLMESSDNNSSDDDEFRSEASSTSVNPDMAA